MSKYSIRIIKCCMFNNDYHECNAYYETSGSFMTAVINHMNKNCIVCHQKCKKIQVKRIGGKWETL